MKKIIHHLGNLPLALEQAGTYISRRQYSFTRYLQEFEDSITHSNQGSLSERLNQSVSATWELSFKAIQEENPVAADLLLLCGYLNNRDLPEQLLQECLKLPERGKSYFANAYLTVV